MPNPPFFGIIIYIQGTLNSTGGVLLKIRIKPLLSGTSAGFINGLLGSGGGMIAVPALKSQGLDPQKAHATSIAVIFPMSILSAGIYLFRGDVTLSDALPYLPAGAVGALIGALLLRRIPDKLLRKIFGAFAIWAGLRLMLR